MPPINALTRLPVWRRRVPLTPAAYEKYDTVLQVVVEKDNTAPYAALFAAAARRRRKNQNAPLTLPQGTAVSRLCWREKDDTFTRLQCLRKVLQGLLALSPKTLALDVRVAGAGEDTLFAALVATASMPRLSRDKKHEGIKIALAVRGRCDTNRVAAAARANTLARALAQLPPNVLTPASFAATARRLGRKSGLTVTAYSAADLRRLGAGAVLAVGRASATNPPLLLRLCYQPRAARRVVLVGKGVCFDTGGVNVKPARYMRGMSKDMAGAAVALAAVLAAAEMRLGVGVDAWLALAENAIGPEAYRPDEVITALNGKSIEIVHTDAEGRMLLADTLTLASRTKPAALVSFATLTGTMHVALGERMSGFFADNDEGGEWRRRALDAAAASGERLCYFPAPPDYRAALDSDVADIKQCAEEGEADHIMAALFLREFITGSPPWLHVDLSSASCKGGLAAAPGPLTGFGVAWVLSLLDHLGR